MSGAVSLIRSSVSRWLAARALAGRATAEILRDVAQARIDMARQPAEEIAMVRCSLAGEQMREVRG